MQAARFGDLIGVVHEILADTGQSCRLMRLHEVFIGPLKAGPVGQDGKAGGPAGLIGARQGGRVEIGADQALGGAGFLDLGDQAIAGLRGLGQGAGKATGGRGGVGGRRVLRALAKT